MEICRNWWRLQSGLEILILDPKPFPDQFWRLRDLQAMFQSLIDMTDEVRVSLLLDAECWSGIRVGYMLVRVCLGHSAIESELEYLQMVFITCIQPLFFSLMMNSLTHTTDSLLETTKAVIIWIEV
nr:putative gustatory receptor 85a [Drosophila suzukii]